MINVNDLRKLSNKIQIDDKEYNMGFIPYPVEKDIYSNFDYINTLFANIANIKDEDIEKLKGWIDQILSHKNNNNINYSEKDFFDNVGVTEIIIIMTSIVKYITDRIKQMSSIFNPEGTEKKTKEMN